MKDSRMICAEIKQMIDNLHIKLTYEDLSDIKNSYDEIKLYLNYKIGKDFITYEQKRRDNDDESIENELKNQNNDPAF